MKFISGLLNVVRISPCNARCCNLLPGLTVSGLAIRHALNGEPILRTRPTIGPITLVWIVANVCSRCPVKCSRNHDAPHHLGLRVSKILHEFELRRLFHVWGLQERGDPHYTIDIMGELPKI